MNDFFGTPIFVASYVVLWILTVGLAVTVVAQLHFMGVLFRVLDPVLKFKTPQAKLQPGQPLPSARLVDEFGGVWDVAGVRRARLLLLVNMTCRPCEDLLNRLIPNLQGPVTSRATREVVIVVLGERKHAHELRARHSIPVRMSVLADPGADAVQRWGVQGTPSAILIDANSRVMSLVESPSFALVLELMGLPTEAEAEPRTIILEQVLTREEVASRGS
jgi:hypothetical protein